MNKVVILLITLIFQNAISALSAVCKSEFEETICENFAFSPKIHLSSGANKLIIKNATGVIDVENLSNLETVTEITITGSDLTEIKPGALCSVPNLNSVTILKNKKFPKISKNLLKNCKGLKKVYVDEPGVVVENGAFVEVGDLHTLTFIDAIFPDVIDKTTFRGLDSLKSLTIQSSKLRNIAENAFENLKILKFLELQGDGIEKIEPKTFWKLLELKVLNLSENKLKNLTWDEFKGLRNLRVLFLERNEFDCVNVEKLVKNVPDLERIFLSRDKLSEDTIKDIDNILPKANINVIYV